MAAAYIFIIVMQALAVPGVVRCVKNEVGLKNRQLNITCKCFSPRPVKARRSGGQDPYE